MQKIPYKIRQIRETPSGLNITFHRELPHCGDVTSILPLSKLRRNMENLRSGPRRKSYMELRSISGQLPFTAGRPYWMMTGTRKSLLIRWHTSVARDIWMYFAFVIMPNHVHFIWKDLRMNGKEQPACEFSKV